MINNKKIEDRRRDGLISEDHRELQRETNK